MHDAYSETWWQCLSVGLHECCWCWELHFIDSIMNSQMYCSILKKMFSNLIMIQNPHLWPLLHFL
ncbi:unnamed protein product, partial [Staurois parvus]